MKLESFLQYFTHNVESIIQWVFFAILALAGLLIARGLMAPKSEGEAASAGAMGLGVGDASVAAPEIQGVLKTILERTAKLDSAGPISLGGGGASPEAAAAAEAQVANLRKDIEAKEQEIKALKETAKAAPAGAADPNVAERIKELEAKLAEYEILEDDIADLSLYKEENTRLRLELEKLKGKGPADMSAAVAPTPASAAPAPAPVAPPAPAPVAAAPEPAPGDDIVAEFAQAVSQDPGLPPVEMGVPIPDTGNPMKDFEATVQIEKKMQTEAPAPTPEMVSPGEAQKEADDLFAEFTEIGRAHV